MGVATWTRIHVITHSYLQNKEKKMNDSIITINNISDTLVQYTFMIDS